MLNTYPVREPPQSKGRADEVVKLSGAVKGRGIEINMVMQMALVNVGTDEKLVLSLRPAHGRLITDFVCLLRRNLTGRKSLPDLKEQAPRSTARPVSARYWLFARRNSAGADAGSQR